MPVKKTGGAKKSAVRPDRGKRRPPRPEKTQITIPPPEADPADDGYKPLLAAIAPEKPELLAPAGSKAAWAAAVMAGADAVYLGLNSFSARTYADNFSLKELAGVIKESKEAGVKVYLAFNSLVKESELGEAFKLLAAAAKLGPDAFIIQDLGIAALAKKYFPQIERHASTLTAVHSLPGLVELQNLGFKRAVLARELALDEIKALAEHSPIGVEIFVHGALCFSFSGLCLMSSFLGGRSALRGGCTQPCRRYYQYGSKKGALFSAADFQAAAQIKTLKQMPIHCLKIEGRMKGPDYVGRVVKAYRRLLDAPDHRWPEALKAAEEILSEAPGRRPSSGHLIRSAEGPAILAATTSGLKLGMISLSDRGLAKLTLERPLMVNDRLRLQLSAGEESPAFNLKKMLLDGEEIKTAQTGDTVNIALPETVTQAKGCLFKIASGDEEKQYLASDLVKRLRKRVETLTLPPPVKLSPAELKPSKTGRLSGPGAKTLPLWYWLDKAEDIDVVLPLNPKKIILPLTVPNARHLKNQRRRFRDILGKIVWSLPPLVFYQAQNVLIRELKTQISSGYYEYMASNLGQINILTRAVPKEETDIKLKIWGDHRLGVLNHVAEEALIKLGFNGVTLSLEADEETYRQIWEKPAPGGRLLYIYGRPALFTSRFKLEQRKLPVVSPKGEKFKLSEEGGELVMQAEKPVFMAPLLRMPPLPGGVGLILDFRREPHLSTALKVVKKAVTDGRLSQGTAFNFKRGLV